MKTELSDPEITSFHAEARQFWHDDYIDGSQNVRSKSIASGDWVGNAANSSTINVSIAAQSTAGIQWYGYSTDGGQSWNNSTSGWLTLPNTETSGTSYLFHVVSYSGRETVWSETPFIIRVDTTRPTVGDIHYEVLTATDNVFSDILGILTNGLYFGRKVRVLATASDSGTVASGVAIMSIEVGSTRHDMTLVENNGNPYYYYDLDAGTPVNYVLDIWAWDEASNYNWSEVWPYLGNITIDATAIPAPTATSSASAWTNGDVSITVTDNNTGAAANASGTQRVEYSFDNGEHWYTDTRTSGSATFTPALTDGILTGLTVSVSDGNSYDGTVSFRTVSNAIIPEAPGYLTSAETSVTVRIDKT